MSAEKLYKTCIAFPYLARLALSKATTIIQLGTYIVPHELSPPKAGLSQSNGIVNLCHQHVLLLKLVLANVELMNFFKAFEFESLIEAFPDLALDILSIPQAAAKIHGNTLALLSQDVEVAKLIFSNPDLLNRLEKSYLVSSSYPNEVLSIAYTILYNQEQKSLLTTQTIDYLQKITQGFDKEAGIKYWI